MIKPYADNVILELEPLESTSKGGIHIVDTSRKHKGHRTAKVIASGPGYYSIPTYTNPATLIPNETRAGDRVVVDALAGQDYSLDFNAPRHNKSQEFQELFGRGGEFRIVREQEILGVLEDETDISQDPYRWPEGQWITPKNHASLPEHLKQHPAVLNRLVDDETAG